MLQVLKIHIYKNSREVLKTFFDHQIDVCLEFAQELHKATMGLCEDEKMNKKHSGPYAIHVVNEYGESMWNQCENSYKPSISKWLQ